MKFESDAIITQGQKDAWNKRLQKSQTEMVRRPKEEN